MSTLDMPQHKFECVHCPKDIIRDTRFCRPCDRPWRLAPTLTYADFEAYYADIRGGPLPDPLAVWDRLEAVADTMPSNRAAIDAAINYCREETKR